MNINFQITFKIVLQIEDKIGCMVLMPIACNNNTSAPRTPIFVTRSLYTPEQ